MRSIAPMSFSRSSVRMALAAARAADAKRAASGGSASDGGPGVSGSSASTTSDDQVSATSISSWSESWRNSTRLLLPFDFGFFLPSPDSTGGAFLARREGVAAAAFAVDVRISRSSVAPPAGTSGRASSP